MQQLLVVVGPVLTCPFHNPQLARPSEGRKDESYKITANF